MTTIDYKPTAKQLSDILFNQKIDFYEDEITKGKSVRTEIEIPIARVLDKDSSRYFKALQICDDLIEQGLSVIVSEDYSLVTITIQND